MVLVERSNLRSHVNDTTFHSFRSAYHRAKNPRVVSKNTNAWFFSHHSHERRRSLFFFFSLFLSRMISNARTMIRSNRHHTNPREEERFERQNFKRLYGFKRTFFILDLRFHVVDGIRRLHFERDGFAR